MQTRSEIPAALPPGPRSGWLTTWLAWRYKRAPLLVLERLAGVYGDLSTLQIGPRRLYLLNHPDFIQAACDLSAGNPAQATEFDPALADMALPSPEWQVGSRLDLYQAMLHLTWALPGPAILASALTWTCCLLGAHPVVAAALQLELTTELAGRTPTAADAGRLPFVRQVLLEALRLYPPLPVIEHRLDQPLRLGGYDLPAGAVLLFSAWVMQRDARYYPHPALFDPQRWAHQRTDSLPAGAYFPFGAGPACPGQGPLWTLLVRLLAHLNQHWYLHLTWRGMPQVAQPETQAGQILRPRGKLPLRAEWCAQA